MHGFPGTDTIVEEDGHIGHGAVLHGCIVQRNALVGMNAVSTTTPSSASRRWSPRWRSSRRASWCRRACWSRAFRGKLVRTLTEQELAWKIEGTQSYQELTRRSLRRCGRRHRSRRPSRIASGSSRRAAAVVGAQGTQEDAPTLFFFAAFGEGEHAPLAPGTAEARTRLPGRRAVDRRRQHSRRRSSR